MMLMSWLRQWCSCHDDDDWDDGGDDDDWDGDGHHDDNDCNDGQAETSAWRPKMFAVSNADRWELKSNFLLLVRDFLFAWY